MASPKGLNLVQGQSRWEGLWGSGSPFPPDLYFSAYLGCRFDKEKFAVFLNLFEPSPFKNFLAWIRPCECVGSGKGTQAHIPKQRLIIEPTLVKLL